MALGGLYVIGTSRHESRRIDDQLRGRAGRQGDPGSSRFFVSLDDDLIRRYGVIDLIPQGHRPAPRSSRSPTPSSGGRWPGATHHRGAELRDPPDLVAILGDGGRAALRNVRAARRPVARRKRPFRVRGGSAGALCRARACRRRRGGSPRRAPPGPHPARQALEQPPGLDRRDPRGHSPAALRGTQPADGVPAADHRRVCRDDGRFARRGGGDVRRLRADGGRIDLERAGLRGPSSTWTYLINDNPFSSFGLSLIAPGNMAVAVATATLAVAYFPVTVAVVATTFFRRWLSASEKR